MKKLNQIVILSLLSFCFVIISIIFSICKYKSYTALLAGFAILIALLAFCLNMNNLKPKK